MEVKIILTRYFHFSQDRERSGEGTVLSGWERDRERSGEGIILSGSGKAYMDYKLHVEIIPMRIVRLHLEISSSEQVPRNGTVGLSSG
jgi:hypothetical protein